MHLLRPLARGSQSETRGQRRWCEASNGCTARARPVAGRNPRLGRAAGRWRTTARSASTVGETDSPREEAPRVLPRLLRPATAGTVTGASSARLPGCTRWPSRGRARPTRGARTVGASPAGTGRDTRMPRASPAWRTTATPRGARRAWRATSDAEATTRTSAGRTGVGLPRRARARAGTTRPLTMRRSRKIRPTEKKSTAAHPLGATKRRATRNNGCAWTT